ncbi:hypothetical protein PHAVU_007G080100 [Phaseolus vulgaris]|uniref:Uncharacterized protein n=1 Tax=Phaseolus vulgaris TaxID=3885 RepID=V7BCG7_PHAVU|nr:hypothetical protein PHAVU_007G080100g [Phaseolus vulgaris]ESW15534.1 hypothetical protein PHAVU_007G080100g [Phaseolus vulgaris]
MVILGNAVSLIIFSCKSIIYCELWPEILLYIDRAKSEMLYRRLLLSVILIKIYVSNFDVVGYRDWDELDVVQLMFAYFM